MSNGGNENDNDRATGTSPGNPLDIVPECDAVVMDIIAHNEGAASSVPQALGRLSRNGRYSRNDE